jgi:Ser/Thr protein kinase RdoA (MazF antagonist)
MAMIDAARLARELYGLDAAATALPGEHDLNFRLDANGSRYVLKLHRPGADLELEDAVLEHLRDEPAVPRLAGRTADAGERTARLLTWLDGQPWAGGGGDLESLGRTVARVDRALKAFEHPHMRRHHRWDLRNAPELGIPVPPLDHLPHQVIHNDANEHNVLVADDGTVVGLIDFGDVVHTARVCGLAVAGAYAMQGQPDPARAVVAVVRGYHEVTPLAPDELAVLFELMLVRLRMSVAMAERQSAAAPDNAYLLISQAGVREARARVEHQDPQLAPIR